ncbi:hypothetical protein [Peribacillus kribbensis]|uniref:hypothetical protein n=1 Tax=Peribacillus kribbensis TaxID=356658 RepID=UPI00047EAA8D|nr:hypothetical protein [Peribacillus kribbensis]
MSKYWEPCPRCNSNKVTTTSKAMQLFVMWFLAGGSMVIGFFFWPMFIFMVLFLLATPIVLFLPKSNVCGECKFVWKVNKKKALA